MTDPSPTDRLREAARAFIEASVLVDTITINNGPAYQDAWDAYHFAQGELRAALADAAPAPDLLAADKIRCGNCGDDLTVDEIEGHLLYEGRVLPSRSVATSREADHPGLIAWTRGHGQGDWCRVHGVIPGTVSVKQHILDQHPDIDYGRHLERAIANEGIAAARTALWAALDAVARAEEEKA